MGLYRKKPVVIEAFQWTGDDRQLEDPAWITDAIRAGKVWFENPGSPEVTMLIVTLEGTHRASRGDWIIKGVKGELYPCKPDIFAETYESVDPLFALGSVVATPEAIAAIEANGLQPIELLTRHYNGDWGTLCDEDKALNDEAVKLGNRILSAYPIASDVTVWIITEADRSATTILLPEEY